MLIWMAGMDTEFEIGGVGGEGPLGKANNHQVP